MIDSLQTLTGFQFFAYVILQILTSPTTYVGVGIIIFLMSWSRSIHFSDAQKFANTVVLAAEQIGFFNEPNNEEANKQKFLYAVGTLRERFPSLSEETAVAMVEAAVYAMNFTMKR